jgi:hypothetical protein
VTPASSSQRRSLRPGRTLVTVALALPLAAGVAAAIRSAWLSDDSFIPFRYVDQWMRGNGLVFNPGERVEGYSDFFWVVLLGVARRLGADLQLTGCWLPLMFWIATLAVLFGRSLGLGLVAEGGALRLRFAVQRSGLAILPVAAWGVALHADMQAYATSGLETSFFTLCILLGLLLVTAAQPRAALAASVYAVATLVRPEGALYALVAAAWLAWPRRDTRGAMQLAAFWTALVAPFLVWRLAYYGNLLPNTFYAKSANLPYWSQGWIYTRMYFFIYPVLIVCLVAGLAWIGRRSASRQDALATRPADPRAGMRGLVGLAMLQIALTVLYVWRVGGDFMFARFFVPVTPFIYLVAEESVRARAPRFGMALLAVLVVGGTLMARGPRQHTFVACTKVHGITNEPNCYPPEVRRDLQRQAGILNRTLAGTGARIALPAGRTMIAYMGQLPYAVEGSGLTDASIAHEPLTQRGRPGHEKGPNDAWLHAHAVPFKLLYGAHRAQDLVPYERLGLEDLVLQVIYWDAPVMHALRGRSGISGVDFERYLDQYLDKPPVQSPEHWLDDYMRIQRFYFRHNTDPARLQRLQALVRAAGVPEASLRAAENAPF